MNCCLDTLYTISELDPKLCEVVNGLILSIIEYMPMDLDILKIYEGNQWDFPDYQKLIQNLIKQTIDQKDYEMKMKLKQILQKLYFKTPANFFNEKDKAQYYDQFSRLELLKEIMLSLIHI
eukprot:TRINITY_DN23016_c0_g1_i1.p4 TRINITY_DN23016_c0_g1~~TRINITY_DN23016_c0_g1_i1.p4  ORF type:complete len:121 (+),score=28.25 TRINITY_DN23016_c0_g1_i1:828-1190(+)